MADGAWGGGGGVVSARWFDSAPNYYHCDWGVKGQTVYFNVKLISAVLGERMRNCTALWILRRSQRKSFHSSSFFLLIESAQSAECEAKISTHTAELTQIYHVSPSEKQTTEKSERCSWMKTAEWKRSFIYLDSFPSDYWQHFYLGCFMP